VTAGRYWDNRPHGIASSLLAPLMGRSIICPPFSRRAGVGERNHHNCSTVLGGVLECVLQGRKHVANLAPRNGTHGPDFVVQFSALKCRPHGLNGRPQILLPQRIKTDLRTYPILLTLPTNKAPKGRSSNLPVLSNAQARRWPRPPGEMNTELLHRVGP